MSTSAPAPTPLDQQAVADFKAGHVYLATHGERAPALTGTLVKPYIAERLGWYDGACRHADALLAMARKRGAGTPAYDALFAGYWALTKEANDHVDALRERGALLFAWRGSRALKLAEAVAA